MSTPTPFDPGLYGWDNEYTRIRATVRMREVNPHNGGKVKPEAKALDGYTGDFMFCWHMDEDDPYPGEIAFAPVEQRGEGWPNDAPAWIASGDMELIKNLEWGKDYF